MVLDLLLSRSIFLGASKTLQKMEEETRMAQPQSAAKPFYLRQKKEALC